RTGQFEGLRAIYNAGNRRGVVVPRCVGKDQRLVDFDIYCPKALAGIGGVPETVLDRSILIRMSRRRPGESVERMVARVAMAEGADVRDRLTAAMAPVETLTLPLELLPTALDDRAVDGWEPLLAIAEAAGGAWPDRARRAAALLAADRDDAAED